MTTTSMIVVSIAVTAVGLTGIRCAGVVQPARAPAERRPRRRLRRPGRPRRSAPPSDLVVAEWCEDVARSLRAGATIAVAVEDTTGRHDAMRSPIDPILAAIRRGRSLVEAVGAADGSVLDPASATGLALTVVRSCADLGGPAAAPLERIAATLRTRAAIADEQMAHSAQAQLSARVLTLVPVALLAMLALTEPNVRGALGTPAGYVAVALGAILNVVGWRWMQRIIGGSR